MVFFGRGGGGQFCGLVFRISLGVVVFLWVLLCFFGGRQLPRGGGGSVFLLLLVGFLLWGWLGFCCYLVEFFVCLFFPFQKTHSEKNVVNTDDMSFTENNTDLFWLTAWEQFHFI